MAAWEAVAGGTLFGQVIEPLAGIADTISSIISPLQTVLKIIQSILKIIRAFLIDLASLLIAVIRTLVDEITKFLRELANSGLYLLTVAPDFSSTKAFYESTQGGFDGFVNKVYNSFFDAADAQRPIFSSGESCGGVVLGVNSGNIVGALNLLALISRGFKNLFQQNYVSPILYGKAGNSCNVIFFERPSLPSDLFTSVRYEIQRTNASGGLLKKIDKPTSVVNDKTQKTSEFVRGSQTSELQTDWQTLTTLEFSSSLVGFSQYMIVDGNDTESPQLVKFDLTERANVVANPLRNPLSPPTDLGPKTFSLSQAASSQFFTYSSTSTQDQVLQTVVSPDDYFKSKFITNYWVDFRVNGFTLPTSATASEGQLCVTSFDGNTVTLNNNVPLGSKVQIYTYVNAKSSDVIALKDFHANHPSSYTQKINVNGGVTNDTTYFYRILVTSSQQSQEADGTLVYPAMAKSNEVRLTPRMAVTNNTMRAYCLGRNKGPFVITLANNKLNFNVGTNNYQVALRPSILNKFSVSDGDFNQKYGLLLNSNFRPNTTNLAQTVINTGNASNQILQALGGTSGITFNYYGSDGLRKVVLPGEHIPRDVEDVLMDLQTQCHDKNVRFGINQGRIMIQDVSGNPSSSVTFVTANDVLGFQVGTCMSVAISEPPDWTRYAVKDFIPQIYDLAELIESFANGLISGIESGVKTIVDFIDLLSAKIQTLQDFLDRVQQLLTALRNLKLLLPNLYILKVGPVNGSFALAEEIRNATNRPLSSVDDVAFGIAFVVGGASIVALPILKAIL